MRPLRYSINVTLDGCCDQRAIPADEDLHRHAVENLAQADALRSRRRRFSLVREVADHTLEPSCVVRRAAKPARKPPRREHA